MKIGRNEPCPCGSGKKYKKCCLNKKKPPESLLWHRLGAAYDKLQDKLLDFARKTFGEMALPLAMDEFLLWPEEENPIERIADHMPLFIPWFLFEWLYDPDDGEMDLPIPAQQPVASAYLDARGPGLDRLAQRLIEANLDEPLSFYEVMNCRPGEGFRLKDILRGIEIEVHERQGSENARPGDILLARVIQIDEVAMLFGCSPILIPPDWKPEIIDLRNAILQEYNHITAQVVAEYDIEIRDLYLYIYESAMTPPQLCNTDGEPLIFHKLHYTIDDPETAFRELAGLCILDDETALRSTATLDNGGKILKAEIPWSRPGHKGSKALDNTILGRIIVDHQKLRIEVNSEARAAAARREVAERLGDHAQYVTTEIQSTNALLDSASPDGGTPDKTRQDELMQLPEVREHMAQVLTDHWEGWMDQTLPALGGKTPRQAVQTPDGRESVEALLLSATRHMTKDDEMAVMSLTAIESVRRRLGLDQPSGAHVKKADEDEEDERIKSIDRSIEAFGRRFLNTLYTDLAFRLRQIIAGNRQLNLQRGSGEIWAAAIVYAIAQLNFLFDPEMETCISPDEICGFFKTKKSTVSNKAGRIRKELDLDYGHPELCAPELVETFRLYETSEGFLVPGVPAGKSISSREGGTKDDPPLENRKRPPDKETTPDPKAPKQESENNDRQLGLFDDW